MSQTWTDNPYQLDHTGSVDLQAMENNFNTLKSLFSGASTPSNNVAGMPWFDTTKKILKIRNQANSAWIGVLYGSASLKLWLYLNAAEDGWVVDSSVTDVILSLKGGTQAYNANGGTQAGTWTQPSHTLITSEVPSHNHGGASGAGGTHTHTIRRGTSAGATPSLTVSNYTVSTGTGVIDAVGNHTHTISSIGGDGSHNHGTTHRPTAAIGTLQYPNV